MRKIERLMNAELMVGLLVTLLFTLTKKIRSLLFDFTGTKLQRLVKVTFKSGMVVIRSNTTKSRLNAILDEMVVMVIKYSEELCLVCSNGHPSDGLTIVPFFSGMRFG